tara:strand:+ start:2031 stop:2174 length:144 start_codon:yes stop_codon:yes gene_type:complete
MKHVFLASNNDNIVQSGNGKNQQKKTNTLILKKSLQFVLGPTRAQEK